MGPVRNDVVTFNTINKVRAGIQSANVLQRLLYYANLPSYVLCSQHTARLGLEREAGCPWRG